MVSATLNSLCIHVCNERFMHCNPAINTQLHVIVDGMFSLQQITSCTDIISRKHCVQLIMLILMYVLSQCVSLRSHCFNLLLSVKRSNKLGVAVLFLLTRHAPHG